MDVVLLRKTLTQEIFRVESLLERMEKDGIPDLNKYEILKGIHMRAMKATAGSDGPRIANVLEEIRKLN